MGKNCIKCNIIIPPKRLEILPNTHTCVNCSTVGIKRGVPVQMGSGDHTWTETVIMDENDYKRHLELEGQNSKLKSQSKAELLSMNSEDDDSGKFDTPDIDSLET